MKPDLKRKALESLADVETSAAQSALEEEMDRLETALLSTEKYEDIEESLQLLSAFAFRVYSRAVRALDSLIVRLQCTEVSFRETSAWDPSDRKTFQNEETLIVAAVDVLLSMRYLALEAVFDILWKLAQQQSNQLYSAAESGLEKLAEYNIDVFYGTNRQHGIGPQPQEALLTKLEALSVDQLQQNVPALVAIARKLLSATMESTSANYREVTWKTTNVPGDERIARVRKRTITLLCRVFKSSPSVGLRSALIDALANVTRVRLIGENPDEINIREVAASDAVEVLRFFEEVLPQQDLAVVQKIEHDSFWIFYHADRDEVQKAAMRIEEELSNNKEYSIYRDLIGFEGIFGDWSELKAAIKQNREPREKREERARDYARTITSKTFDEWRERIVRYAATKSNDLATFPVFYLFLQEFAETSPTLALRLIYEEHERLEAFLIPILRGVWKSAENLAVRDLMLQWVEQGVYLVQCTKTFLGGLEPDVPLLSAILSKGIGTNDPRVVDEIVTVAVSNFTPARKEMLQKLFFPALCFLREQHDTRWVNAVWYQNEYRALVDALSEAELDELLLALQGLPKIEHQAEYILRPIAERDPVRILNFFVSRLTMEAESRKSGSRVFEDLFSAIPYDFSELQEPLAGSAPEALAMVRQLYDGDYGAFIYRGARFLKILYPTLPEAFETELLKLVHSEKESDTEVVLAVLRNYDGSERVDKICREVVKVLPSESELLGEVKVVLASTGVVTGEYGFAEAYEARAERLLKWTKDGNARVRSFAEEYISDLRKAAASERKRADEELAIRKFKYGEK